MHVAQQHAAALRLGRKRSIHVREYALVALFVLSCSISYHSLATLVQLTQASEYSYIAIVLPISAVLIYVARASICCEQDSALTFGVAVMGAVALVTLLLRLDAISVVAEYALTFFVFLLVTFWIGAFCACFGMSAARRTLFPLLFLYLMAPMPEPIIARMIVALQHASADAASALYNITGVPVVRHGLFFVLTNEQIEVAEDCSGIRSSIVLLITGLVFSHLFLRKNWSKILLIAVSVPLAVFKNGLRIFTLSVLANYVDPRFLSGPLHHNGGVVFFSIALAVLVPLLLALRRFETSGAKKLGGPFRSQARSHASQPSPSRL